MDWRRLRADLAAHPGASAVLGDILDEDPDSEAGEPDYRELSPRQWAAVVGRCEAAGVAPVEARSLPHGAKIPTLISSYRKGSCFTTKYVFSEKGGADRAGAGAGRRPRFLSPRECARAMGFPETFQIPGVDAVAAGPGGDAAARGHFYQQIGNAVVPPVVEAVGAMLVAELEAVS